MHIRCIDVLDPVQTVLRVRRAGYILAVVIIQHRKRSADTFCLSDFYRRMIAEIHVLQHRLSVCILRHLKNVELTLLAVGSPVVLRRLHRRIHLVQPAADKSRLLRQSGNHTSSAVKSTCVRAVLRRDVSGVRCQSRQWLPVLQIINVGDIPGEAYPVSSGFSLGHISGPFLREALRIDQALLIKLMQPFDSLAVTGLRRGADHLLVVRDCNMASSVSIAVSLSESVNQNRRILIPVIDDE